jgi:hypothetical protein
MKTVKFYIILDNIQLFRFLYHGRKTGCVEAPGFLDLMDMYPPEFTALPHYQVKDERAGGKFRSRKRSQGGNYPH